MKDGMFWVFIRMVVLPTLFILSVAVTIPHGGLRTSNDNINQNKTYQSFCQEGTPFK